MDCIDWYRRKISYKVVASHFNTFKLSERKKVSILFNFLPFCFRFTGFFLAKSRLDRWINIEKLGLLTKIKLIFLIINEIRKIHIKLDCDVKLQPQGGVPDLGSFFLKLFSHSNQSSHFSGKKIKFPHFVGLTPSSSSIHGTEMQILGKISSKVELKRRTREKAEFFLQNKTNVLLTAKRNFQQVRSQKLIEFLK
ncbi:hypothetical protein BpHYR1_029343 [Brachionus plicatilis]|uniref:Uncharacterized protein n=1 Tax=Brachionus plicatilis TaxID=10195 RepID=A0A3M7PCJ5_BRAPC|nr:hypothetical protein BpHYR1_029343 [Brachionus plicatilis]